MQLCVRVGKGVLSVIIGRELSFAVYAEAIINTGKDQLSTEVNSLLFVAVCQLRTKLGHQCGDVGIFCSVV